MPRRQQCSGTLPEDDTLLLPSEKKPQKDLQPKIALSAQSAEVVGLLDGSRESVETRAEVLTSVSEYPLLECVRRTFVGCSDGFLSLGGDGNCSYHAHTQSSSDQVSYRNSFLLQVDSYLISDSESLASVAVENQQYTPNDGILPSTKSHKEGFQCSIDFVDRTQGVRDKCCSQDFSYAEEQPQVLCLCNDFRESAGCDCLVPGQDYGKSNHYNFFERSQSSFDEIASTLKEICDELEQCSRRLTIEENDQSTLSGSILNSEHKEGGESLLGDTKGKPQSQRPVKGLASTSKSNGLVSYRSTFKYNPIHREDLSVPNYGGGIKEWTCAMESPNLQSFGATSKDFNGIHGMRNSDENGYPEHISSSLDSKPTITALIPELRFTKLTKMTPSFDNKLVKSPSLPASPVSFRSTGGSKPAIPSYLTLGRKGTMRQMTQHEPGSWGNSAGKDNQIDLEELEKIRTIIAGLDLAKYRRRTQEAGREIVPYNHNSLKRSLSAQPKLALEKGPIKKCFLDNIPPPPRSPSLLKESCMDAGKPSKHFRGEPLPSTPSSKIFSLELVPLSESSTFGRPVNSKLRELTQKLMPSSAPPSPHKKTKLTTPFTAPATSEFTFWKEPLPLIEPDHFTFTDDGQVGVFLDSACQNTPSYFDSRSGVDSATLPRSKQPTYGRQRVLSPSLETPLRLTRRNNELAVVSRELSSDVSNGYPQDRSVHGSKSLSDFPELRPKKLLTFSGVPDFQKSSSEGTVVKDSISGGKTNEREQFQIEGVVREPHQKQQSVGTFRGRCLVSKNECDVPGNCGLKPLKIQRSCDDYYYEPRKDNVNHWPDTNFRDSANSEVRDRESTLPDENGNERTSKKKHFSDPISEKHNCKFSESISQCRSEPELKDDGRNCTAAPQAVKGGPEMNGTQNFRLELSRRIVDLPLTENSTDRIGMRHDNTPLTAPVTCSQALEVFGGAKQDTRHRTMSISAGAQDQQPKRYYKKRLRGPYGEMLELEMEKYMWRQQQQKSEKRAEDRTEELDFLKDSPEKAPSSEVVPKPYPLLRSSSHSLDEPHGIAGEDTDLSSPKRKTSANIPLMNSKTEGSSLRVPSSSVSGTVSEPSLHIRSLSVGSSEVKTGENWNSGTQTSRHLKSRFQDTRTHVVSELYETENSYVESLQIVVKKYMQPLKTPELSGIIDSSQVDEIFYQIPEILSHHEAFLDVLKQRLAYWDTKQKIGDVFVEVFTRQALIDTYTAFINNWKSAKEAIKSASHAKPAFAKFLKNTSREHKGKLTLDALLIMPVQRIPRYELLIKELLKHTPADHPDRTLLLQAQKEVHDLAININRVEKEALHQEEMAYKMKEVENLVEGFVNMAESDRSFLRRDFVVITESGTKRDRCLFLLSDLLLVTTIKKKGAAIRKTSLAASTSPYGSLESNKYKLLLRLPLQDIEVVKTTIDERSCRKFIKEMSTLESDVAALGKIGDIIGTLSSPHQVLDDAVKDVLGSLSRHLVDKQTVHVKYMTLELSIRNKYDNLPILFPSIDIRLSWEISFNEAKEKLAQCSRKCLPPEFLCPLPIRKTRAGLQITCAAPVVDSSSTEHPDVWICNSDGFVGQICVLNLEAEPSVTSCNSISNSRILCITSVPGISPGQYLLRRRSTLLPHLPGLRMSDWSSEDSDQPKPSSFQLDSDSSEDEEFIDSSEEDRHPEIYLDEREEDADCRQPTMWLGTEDGCIYVYSCSDLKFKKPKNKLQHPAAVHDIVHIENKIFASLANGVMAIYSRDAVGSWSTSNPQIVQAASTVAPISKMLLISGKLWCGTFNAIAVLNISSLAIEHTFQITTEISKPFLTMVSSGQGVWVAMQNSSIIKLFNALTYLEILQIDVASPVTKMLSACDDIIRQHKSACLRVSALHVCKDLLWIGTSAGVILTLAVPHITHSASQVDTYPNVTGIPQGHTGHVRFITSVEIPTVPCPEPSGRSVLQDTSVRVKETQSKIPAPTAAESVVVISGGDGYEDFSHMAFSEAAGRDDSTNHLLLWKV